MTNALVKLALAIAFASAAIERALSSPGNRNQKCARP